MANVELKNLTKKYGDVVAVQNMNLNIPHNEFLVLVGPSGCGKSTTLRMIAGLEEITSGEIFIGDKLVNEKDPKDRNVSMVFQNYALYPHMTVEENLGFSLKIAKVEKTEIEERVKEFLDANPHFRQGSKSGSGSQSAIEGKTVKPFNIQDLDMGKPEDRAKYAEYRKERDSKPTQINLTSK